MCMPRFWRVPDRSIEEHRRSSFTAFGGPQGLAKLSPGRQACPTWDKLHQLVQASQARPGPQAHDRSLAVAAQYRHSALILGLLLALPGLAAEKDPCAAVSTAQDVRFELALKDHGAIFQTGEIVPLSLSFSSTKEGRYTAMVATYDRSGRLHEEHYCVEPESPDPLGTYYKTRGVMGGGLRGMQLLGEAPFLADAELNEWRSLPAGHYHVHAISYRVSRPRDPEEDTPNNNVGETLRSNAVEFDVTEADPAWQREQLRAAVAVLDGKPSQDEERRAARVLRFLNTQDAARELAKRFWGLNQQQRAGWEFMFGLYGSPHRQVAVDAMQAELAVPDHAITREFLDVLVSLQLNGEAEWRNPPTADSTNLTAVQAYWARRREREQALMKAAVTVVLESLPRKTGSARALTLNGLLAAGEQNPALAESVRPALIASWADLPAETREELILYRWPAIAGPEMLPILRKIVAEPPPPARTQQGMTRDAALKHLYELDPAAGREATLGDLQSGSAEPSVDVVRLLPKEDLVSAARQASKRIVDGGARELDFELLDRYGEASALPAVKAAFEAGIGEWACAPQSAMLRYFLRVSPDDGVAQVKASLAARNDTGCYSVLLPDLDDQLPKVQPIAIGALDDPDPEVARSAVRALGRWGSKEAEAVLWERLKRFHKEWAGREDSLRFSPDGKSAGSRGAMLEQDLVTAIGQGTNWLAPPEKLALLKDLVCTREQAQLIEGWIQQWKLGAATIDSYWVPEDRPTFSILQYTGLTEDQLRIKVAQLPHDIDLQWRFWNSGEPSLEKQEEVYQRVRADAAANGVVINQTNHP
jgi:hypothetical protein